MENITVPTPHVPRLNKMWCCTAEGRQLRRALQYYAVKYSGRQQIGSVLVIQDVTESRKMLRQLATAPPMMH